MLPPRSSAGLGEASTTEDPGRLLSVSEIKEIAADVSSATIWETWVATVRRWQPSLHSLLVRGIAVVHQRPMDESSSVFWSYRYNISENMAILDELCATVASGLRLMCADGLPRRLHLDGNSAVVAAAAGQSIDLLETVISALQESLEQQLERTQASDAPTAGQQLHAGKPEHRLQLCF
jgi:hypothetical protein